MRFLGKFFSKKEEKQKISIKEEALEEFIRERISSIWRDHDFKQEKIERKINDILKKNEELYSLEEKEEKLQENKRFAVMSKSAKDNVCFAVKKELDFEFNSLKDFYINGSRALSNVGEVISRYDSRVKISFSKEYYELLQHLKKLSLEIRSIENIARDNIEKEEEFYEWIDFIKKYNKDKELVKALERKIAHVEENLEEKKKSLSELLIKSKELKESKRFSEYIQSNERIESLEKQANSLAGEFTRIISNVEKALVYYKNKLADSKTRRIIEKIIEQKGNFVSSRDNFNSLKDIFLRLSEVVDDMALNDKRKQKVDSSLKMFIENHIELFERMETVKLRAEKERQIISSYNILNDLKKLEDEINYERKEILREELKLTTIREEIKSKTSKLKEDNKKILHIKKELSCF